MRATRPGTRLRPGLAPPGGGTGPREAGVWPLRSPPWPRRPVRAERPVHRFPATPAKCEEKGGGLVEKTQYDTCVIGAGPAGLAVARALAERNLPYTHLERHTGPGGIWDIDNPGSPMYESAHFISSRT